MFSKASSFAYWRTKQNIFAHTSIFQASSRVHTKTPEDESNLHQLQSHVFVNLNEYDDF